MASLIRGITSEPGFERVAALGVQSVHSLLHFLKYIYTNLRYVNSALIRAAPSPAIGGSSKG